MLQPLAKSVLIPFGLTTAVPAVDARIHKKFLGLRTTTILLNKEIIDVMKIVKSLQEPGLLTVKRLGEGEFDSL